ncbi:hypothetical protein B0H17DRAFT_1149732 [Mycena rosella]|uniref:Uncharacterized protein n=1 Tax=Mycena rosella TaxID=1033263 RepID=A0AAD7BYH0_MYCRO|nr:hypothetical protein B0H17DRAFT_1149732 [Mycena rosella]
MPSSNLELGFLDRQQIGAAEGKKGGRGKRARVAQADEEAGQTYEWCWGARAQSKVGEQAVTVFVAEFMAGDERQEDAEEEEGGAGAARANKRRADAESKLARMTKGIKRAVGGQLSEIK